jgi:hypothetical protein
MRSKCPVEVLPLADGKRMANFIGNLVNGTGSPITLLKWYLEVKYSDGILPLLKQRFVCSFLFVKLC